MNGGGGEVAYQNVKFGIREFFVSHFVQYTRRTRLEIKNYGLTVTG